MKTPQTLTDFENHLREQLYFLRASAKSYDEGFEGEAKRLATIIRILVHDTSKSTSLLTAMNVKNNLKYYDSVREPEVGCLFFISVGMRTTEKGLRYFPNLKIPNKKKDFNDWWNGVVIISHDLYFTRKTIITTVANQDGGTHVDPLLDTKYANLSRNNGIGWEITFEESGEKGVTENGPELPLVRQIAHELHLTLSEQLGV